MCTTGRVYKVYRPVQGQQTRVCQDRREFAITLQSHLGSTFADMTVRYGRGNFYKDLHLTEPKAEYVLENGHDDRLPGLVNLVNVVK